MKQYEQIIFFKEATSEHQVEPSFENRTLKLQYESILYYMLKLLEYLQRDIWVLKNKYFQMFNIIYKQNFRTNNINGGIRFLQICCARDNFVPLTLIKGNINLEDTEPGPESTRRSTFRLNFLHNLQIF